MPASAEVKLGALGLFITFCIIVAVGIGWISNIYKFASSDFQAPYKQEILRGIGIPFTPLGAVLGYVHIDDEPPFAVRETESVLMKDLDK